MFELVELFRPFKRLKSVAVTTILVTIFAPSLSMAEKPNLSEFRNVIAGLYPELSPAQIRQKLQAPQSPHELMRSVVRYHLWSLKHLANDLSVPPLGPTIWCVNDAHTENFGVLMQKTADPLFSINDFDDAQICPAGADLLRFLTSVELAQNLKGERVDLGDLDSQYISGLVGDRVKLSKIVTDRLMHAITEGQLAKWTSFDRSSFDSTTQELNHETKSLIMTELRRVLKAPFDFVDGIAFIRTEGGSFGGHRIRLILKGERLFNVELKEWWAPTDSLSRSTRAFLGTDPSELGLAIIAIGSKNFLVRPRSQAHRPLELDDLSADDALKVLRDEIQILGSLHGRQIRKGQFEPQMKEFHKAAKAYAQQYKDLFKALNR